MGTRRQGDAAAERKVENLENLSIPPPVKICCSVWDTSCTFAGGARYLHPAKPFLCGPRLPPCPQTSQLVPTARIGPSPPFRFCHPLRILCLFRAQLFHFPSRFHFP